MECTISRPPVFANADVVLSTLGESLLGKHEIRLIDIAKRAGVKWYIPSNYGADLDAIGDEAVERFGMWREKLKANNHAKASGMDWTMIYTGWFEEWLLSAWCGVDLAKHTLTIPMTGQVRLAATSIVDIGTLTADAIVTGRGRNASVYFAGSNFSFDEFADMLERESGKPWHKVVRTEAEVMADFTAPEPASHIAFLQHGIFHYPKCVGWSVAESYNGKHGIATTPVEVILHRQLAPAPAAAT